MTRSPADARRDESLLPPGLAILILLCAIVLLFRSAAWLNPSSAVDIPQSLRLPTGALGVLYLVCGVWAWRSNPSALTRVFLMYGIGGAVHWGGTIAVESQGVETALLVFYMAATAMGDAAFLDLALRYPRALNRRRFPTVVLYLLAIVTLLAVPVAPFLRARIVEAGLGFVIAVAFMMAIAGGVVFIVQWFRATPAERREYSLTLIVGVLVVTSGIDLLADGGLLPGDPAAWSLMYGFEPLVLAWALTRRGARSR